MHIAWEIWLYRQADMVSFELRGSDTANIAVQTDYIFLNWAFVGSILCTNVA